MVEALYAILRMDKGASEVLVEERTEHIDDNIPEMLFNFENLDGEAEVQIKVEIIATRIK